MTFILERAKTGRKPAFICDVYWDTGTIRYTDFAVPVGAAIFVSSSTTITSAQSLISKIVTAPTRKSTGAGVGSRAIYNITLNDTRADDGVGTVLGRQMAADPFWHKRQVDIYVGYLTDPFDIDNFQKRTYFIDNITPLNDKNTITINTIDPLESLNDKRSIVPIASFGKLVGALSAGATGSVDITDTTNFDATGHCIIDSEAVAYTLVSGTNINITARGQLGTTDADHSLGAAVKNSYVRLNINVVDAIRDLIEDFTDIDPTFIPDAQWDQERDDYLLAEQMDLVVPTSKSVKSIINQLCEQSGVSIWWDERVSEIPLKSDVPAIFPEFELNTQQNVLDNGHKQTQNMQKLVTRVIYHFNKINKIGSDDQENFEDTLEIIDLANEVNQQDRGIVEIFASYARSTGTAAKVASRLINRRNNGAREVFWKMDPKDGDVWTGDDVRLTSDLFQDENGLDRSFAIEIVEVKENDGLSYSYKGTIISEESHNQYALIGPNTLVDFLDESQSNKDTYAFISTNEPNPVMGDGSAAYRIL